MMRIFRVGKVRAANARYGKGRCARLARSEHPLVAAGVPCLHFIIQPTQRSAGGCKSVVSHFATSPRLPQINPNVRSHPVVVAGCQIGNVADRASSPVIPQGWLVAARLPIIESVDGVEKHSRQVCVNPGFHCPLLSKCPRSLLEGGLFSVAIDPP